MWGTEARGVCVGNTRASGGGAGGEEGPQPLAESLSTFQDIEVGAPFGLAETCEIALDHLFDPFRHAAVVLEAGKQKRDEQHLRVRAWAREQVVTGGRKWCPSFVATIVLHC